MKKRLFALMLAMSLVSAVLAGCAGGSKTENPGTDNAPTLKELNIGIAQDLDDSLDPHKNVAAGTREIMFNVFEGLMKPTSTGDLIPAVAESYTVSDDHLTYTFKLREGVKFHNGQTVTPDDVLYSYNRCMEDNAEIQVKLPANIDKVYVENGDICFQLTEPSNEFLSYLTVAIIPADYTEQDTKPVGTGPFKFVSHTAQDSVVMERFEEYWGESAKLDKVTFKIIENADNIVLSLQSGAVDLFAHLTTAQTSQLGAGFHVEAGTMNLVQALYLNNAVAPFDDVRVRQALCYAVDREAMIDLAFDGYGYPIGTSIYPAFVKYYDESLVNNYPHDVEKAKALLAEAGYPDGFAMSITVPSNYKPHMDTAEVLVQQLAEVGVTATIQPVEWETWLSDTYVGRQFESTVVGVDAANMTARSLLERFTSTAGNNFVNYNNAEYDTLYAAAQASFDDAEQTALYRQAAANLSENAANVYLQDMADLVAVRDGVEGLNFYPIYVLDLSTLDIAA